MHIKKMLLFILCIFITNIYEKIHADNTFEHHSRHHHHTYDNHTNTYNTNEADISADEFSKLCQKIYTLPAAPALIWCVNGASWSAMLAGFCFACTGFYAKGFLCMIGGGASAMLIRALHNNFATKQTPKYPRYIGFAAGFVIGGSFAIREGM